jgi:hypothetical protein
MKKKKRDIYKRNPANAYLKSVRKQGEKKRAFHTLKAKRRFPI